MHVWRNTFEAMPKDDTAFFDTVRALQAGRKKWESLGDQDLIRAPFREFVTCCNAAGTNLASYRLMKTAIRLKAHHARHGVYPDVLPDWGVDIRDPFSDTTLVYQRKNTGFVLYSIGAYRIDQGGLGYPKENGAELSYGADLVITVR